MDKIGKKYQTKTLQTIFAAHIPLFSFENSETNMKFNDNNANQTSKKCFSSLVEIEF